MNSRRQRALQFKDKAAKWLRWARATHKEMTEHGEAIRMDDVDRTFTTLIFQIATVHEALDSAGSTSGLDDWCKTLNDIRNNDPLLFYLWMARNTETHDALIKWTPDMNTARTEVIDAGKASAFARQAPPSTTQGQHLTRLLFYLYEVGNLDELRKKMQMRFRPSSERCGSVGMRLHHVESLTLSDFTTRDKKGKVQQVKAPRTHSAANVAAQFAITRYEALLAELEKQIA